MVLSSLAVAMMMGSWGAALPLAEGIQGVQFERSARLLAQADSPTIDTSARLRELDSRIVTLKDSRRGKGLMIAGLIVAPVVILPTGLVLFFIGLAAETLLPGVGIGTLVIGSVLLAVTLGVVVLCIIGLVSVGNHNADIDQQVRAAETERQQLLRAPGPRPISMDWAPIKQVTIARF